MPNHTPKFKPGQDPTLTASADVLGGQLTAVSGSNTVAATSASTASWLGVARQDAKSGEKVVVTRGGVQPLTASGAIAAGDRVVPAAGGKVAALGGGNAAHSVGTSLTAAADGAKAFVAMDR